jgi:hypothetical protein
MLKCPEQESNLHYLAITIFFILRRVSTNIEREGSPQMSHAVDSASGGYGETQQPYNEDEVKSISCNSI